MTEWLVERAPWTMFLFDTNQWYLGPGGPLNITEGETMTTEDKPKYKSTPSDDPDYTGKIVEEEADAVEIPRPIPPVAVLPIDEPEPVPEWLRRRRVRYGINRC